MTTLMLVMQATAMHSLPLSMDPCNRLCWLMLPGRQLMPPMCTSLQRHSCRHSDRCLQVCSNQVPEAGCFLARQGSKEPSSAACWRRCSR